MEIAAPPPVSSSEFCDWRVQSQGNCEGVTYVSFLYTTHIISSFLFLFISIGILIHNIWWKGQKIWEFSRNDRAFRPRPTEGFVLCKKRRASHELESQSPTTLTNDKNVGRLSSLMGPKRVYLPTPMVLNLTLMGLILLPLISNQILASFAGRAFDRGDFDLYNSLIAAMYGVWTFIVGVIFVLYIFFGNVGRVSSRIGSSSEYEDNERQLNTLKSTYQRMRAILILCGSLSPLMGLMMLFFAIFRRQILNSTVASEAFSLIWIHGARYDTLLLIERKSLQ
ncbi:hypothetical protein BGZ90_009827 [Linnemannia elongata]|nr:hypothetical protein BGZ90_009827 [Linnemannia elongata]